MAAHMPEWRRRYVENKRRGLCVRCSKPAGLKKNGRPAVRCIDCRSYAASWMDNQRSLRTLKGLCTECGKSPRARPWHECGPCLKKKHQRNDRRGQVELKRAA